MKLQCKMVTTFNDFSTFERDYYLHVPEGTTQYDSDLDDKVISVGPVTPITEEEIRVYEGKRIINSWFELPNGVRISDYDPSYVDSEDARMG